MPLYHQHDIMKLPLFRIFLIISPNGSRYKTLHKGRFPLKRRKLGCDEMAMIKKHKRIVIATCTVVIVVISLFSYISQTPSPAQPVAKQGYLDLSAWDFQKNGNVMLDGEWEFYWNQLLYPKDFQVPSSADGYMLVPSEWSGRIGNTQLTDKGFATYRLRVRLGNELVYMGIKTVSIRMSCRVFIDGVEVLTSGVPTTSEAGYVTANIPRTVSFNPTGNKVEIVVQVADFDYKAGGIVQSISLGSSAQITGAMTRSNVVGAFVSAFFLASGTYYLLVYLGRRKNISSLYFGIYCILTACFTMIYGDKILLQAFPDLPYVTMLRVQNMLLDLSVIFVCLFVNQMTALLPRWYVVGIAFAMLGYIVAYWVLPLAVVTSVETLFLILGTSVYLIVSIMLAVALVRNRCGSLGRAGAALLLMAFLCALVVFTTGTLYVNNMLSSNVGNIVFVVFVLLISGLLSRQYNEAYNIIENMNVHLMEMDKLKDELMGTQLSFLQAQIKPHFLYNSLTVISALSIRDPKRTKELLYDLSDYLRGSFQFENTSGLTPLSGELATVRAYLSIEKERFQSKLRVEWDVDETVGVPVPVLAIQPLVENALRHGILKRPQGGTVRISVKRDGVFAVICVEDDGVGIAAERMPGLLDGQAQPSGVGLKNIHRRMILSYGHGLEIESRENKGTTVTMKIPYQPGGETT